MNRTRTLRILVDATILYFVSFVVELHGEWIFEISTWTLSYLYKLLWQTRFICAPVLSVKDFSQISNWIGLRKFCSFFKNFMIDIKLLLLVWILLKLFIFIWQQFSWKWKCQHKLSKTNKISKSKNLQKVKVHVQNLSLPTQYSR